MTKQRFIIAILLIISITVFAREYVVREYVRTESTQELADIEIETTTANPLTEIDSEPKPDIKAAALATAQKLREEKTGASQIFTDETLNYSVYEHNGKVLMHLPEGELFYNDEMGVETLLTDTMQVYFQIKPLTEYEPGKIKVTSVLGDACAYVLTYALVDIGKDPYHYSMFTTGGFNCDSFDTLTLTDSKTNTSFDITPITNSVCDAAHVNTYAVLSGLQAVSNNGATFTHLFKSPLFTKCVKGDGQNPLMEGKIDFNTFIYYENIIKTSVDTSIDFDFTIKIREAGSESVIAIPLRFSWSEGFDVQ